MADFFFISLGAILGANIRFQILNKLKKSRLKSDFYILIINIFASFSLGFFLPIINQLGSFIYSYQVILFFSLGFLGSMSSFSSYINDLYDLCLQFKFSRALNLFVFSSSLGVFAFAFGFFLGNQ